MSLCVSFTLNLYLLECIYIWSILIFTQHHCINTTWIKHLEALFLETVLCMAIYEFVVQVKSVPFSGTGKHKYSFQRVEVPPLPIHFCDCEEHSVNHHTAKEKRTCDLEAESGAMNEEELNIMNSVMNKIFEREKMVSDSAHSGNILAKERDDSFKSIHSLQYDDNEADSATDEDNLIINVVSRRNNRMALIGDQEKEIISENQVELNVQLVEYICFLCCPCYPCSFFPKFC